MVESVRPVPAVLLKLGFIDLDTKMRRGQMTVQELVTNPPPPSIVIPMDFGRSFESLLLQWSFRLPRFGGYWAVGGWRPTGGPDVIARLMLRDSSGNLRLLSAGPMFFSWDDAGSTLSWAFPQSITREQWLSMSIFLDSSGVKAWCSATNQEGNLLQTRKALSLTVEALIIVIDQGSWTNDEPELMIADLRLWAGRTISEVASLRESLNRRLDGREPGLVAYWKLGEGQGTRIGDSSRYDHHGTLTGGSWVSAADSGLTLDCGREIGRENLRQRREEIGQQLNATRLLSEDVAKLSQEKQRLATHIEQLKANQKALDDRVSQDLQAREAAQQKLEDDYRAWQDDIEDGGKVAVSTFSNTIAQEIDRVTQRLNTAQSPYALQSLDLEVKALPVAGQHDTGMRLRFPAMDDKKIQSDQLSTLRMSFAARPSEPVRARAAVPDVRGCTEALARRQLGLAGFRVEVLDQAAISEEEIGRVVGQVPSPDILAEPDKIVRVFIGQPSGTGAPHPTLPAGEGEVVTGKDRKR